MDMDLTHTRNIGVCAHIDAGKTTVTERILFYTGKNYKLGEVHEGTATMDFLEEEQDRGITIQSAATTCPWTRNGEDYKVNLIDTPGHVDFTIEVERSLRVLDGAIAVFDGKEGVEAQSETVWRQADRYNVPRLCFINKMDKLGADFEFSFRTIKERLGANPIAVQYPIGSGNELEGIIDLLAMKAYYFYADEKGAVVTEKDIPTDLLDKATEWHHKLVETAAELEDSLMEKYLEDESTVTADDIRAALRKGAIELRCNPTFCGAALRNIGVQRLLDGVIDYLPAPDEVPNVEGTHHRDPDEKLTRPNSDDAPLSALVFKVVNDAHGDLTYVRVYSGVLKKGSRLLNPVNGKKENVSRIFEMHAQNREPLEEAGAGSIVAVIGIKDSYTGDTLCDADDPIVLERMSFPEPVISMAIEPHGSDDKRRLSEALATIRREDPSFSSHFDEETGQTIIAGMGELHLEIIKNKLTRDMKVGCDVGKPRVSYRETIQGPANNIRGKFVKQTGGRGQFGDCTINIEPYTQEQAEEEGLKFKECIAFKNGIVGGAIPKEFIPSVEAGVRQTALAGITAAYPLINVKVTLIDGSSHAVDSSQVAFEQAGRLALQQAVAKAGSVLLEPIMKVVVTSPEDYLGNITGDLNSRRGIIVSTEDRGHVKMVTAEVPLSKMFGYTTSLRGMSQGRATSTMEFLEYRAMPASMAKEVIEAG